VCLRVLVRLLASVSPELHFRSSPIVICAYNLWQWRNDGVAAASSDGGPTGGRGPRQKVTGGPGWLRYASDLWPWFGAPLARYISYGLPFLRMNIDTGVNPAGDAGDTSPPIFWFGGHQRGYPPNIITYFRI